MPNKATDFRNEQQRAKHNLPKKVKKPRLIAGTKRARGAANATMHEHTGAKGGAKATVVIEESLSGRASRKSTRASANGQKSGAVLEHVAQVRSSQPSARRG